MEGFKVGDQVERIKCSNGEHVPVGSRGLIRTTGLDDWPTVDWRRMDGSILRDGANNPEYLKFVSRGESPMASYASYSRAYQAMADVGDGAKEVRDANARLAAEVVKLKKLLDERDKTPCLVPDHMIVKKDPYKEHCQSCANLKEVEQLHSENNRMLLGELYWYRAELQRYNPKLVKAHEESLKREAREKTFKL